MSLRLPDRWIWDSWYIWDGELCHAFYLCASRGLGDPNRRHRNTNVGHAVSKDLENWEVLPDALSPSESPAFDSWTTWTGSVVKGDDGRWWMFYTGTSRETEGKVQTIGAAVSDDLITWHKLDNPLVVADPLNYETIKDDTWSEEHWRDPWVYKDPSDNLWHMLITARGKNRGQADAGVLGHAVSKDMISWEVLQPLSDVGLGFANLEVFQRVTVDEVPLLIFCCGWRELDVDRINAQGKVDYTYSVVVQNGIKGANFAHAKPFLPGELYAGRVIQKPSGESFLIGFINFRDGKFVGELSDPIPVTANFSEGLIRRD